MSESTKKTRPPTRHIAPFGLRMQEELKEALEKSAWTMGRSLNAEIVDRLQESMNYHGKTAQHFEMSRSLAAANLQLADAHIEKISSDLIIAELALTLSEALFMLKDLDPKLAEDKKIKRWEKLADKHSERTWSKETMGAVFDERDKAYDHYIAIRDERDNATHDHQGETPDA